MFRSWTYYFCVVFVKLLITPNGVDEQDDLTNSRLQSRSNSSSIQVAALIATAVKASALQHTLLHCIRTAYVQYVFLNSSLCTMLISPMWDQLRPSDSSPTRLQKEDYILIIMLKSHLFHFILVVSVHWSFLPGCWVLLWPCRKCPGTGSSSVCWNWADASN